MGGLWIAIVFVLGMASCGVIIVNQLATGTPGEQNRPIVGAIVSLMLLLAGPVGFRIDDAKGLWGCATIVGALGTLSFIIPFVAGIFTGGR